jgi:hypothetical protein
LADRLFTRPTHSLVNVDTVSTSREMLSAWHRQTQPSGVDV